jgi:hypothetical protein
VLSLAPVPIPAAAPPPVPFAPLVVFKPVKVLFGFVAPVVAVLPLALLGALELVGVELAP